MQELPNVLLIYQFLSGMYVQMAFSFIAFQVLPSLQQKVENSSPEVALVARTLSGIKRYLHTNCLYVIVPEKRDLNEANMKIEICPFSSSSK